MSDRFGRIAITAALVLMALYVGQPYVAALLFSAEPPRAITARGDLAQAEVSTATLFERASPSVVHVFAQAAAQGRSLMSPDAEEAKAAPVRRRVRASSGMALGMWSPTITWSQRLPSGAGRCPFAFPRVKSVRRRSSALRRATISPYFASAAPAPFRRPSPSVPRRISRSGNRPSPSGIHSVSTIP